MQAASCKEMVREISCSPSQPVIIADALPNGLACNASTFPVAKNCIVTYTLSDHGLEISTVLSSLALFNLLPLVVGQMTEAWDSLERIQGYSLLQEQTEEAVFDVEAPHAVEQR